MLLFIRNYISSLTSALSQSEAETGKVIVLLFLNSCIFGTEGRGWTFDSQSWCPIWSTLPLASKASSEVQLQECQRL